MRMRLDLALIAIALLAAPAMAEDEYPTHPVRLIAPCKTPLQRRAPRTGIQSISFSSGRRKTAKKLPTHSSAV
jgi:hypothetical protein